VFGGQLCVAGVAAQSAGTSIENPFLVEVNAWVNGGIAIAAWLATGLAVGPALCSPLDSGVALAVEP